MYLAVSTRPDIAFAVSMLSQFNQHHGKEHWNAAKRVLRYLKGTLDHGLTFKKTGEKLRVCVDADWAGSIDDRRSFTGYSFILASATISWETRKQRTVALSSTEAEYMALSDGALLGKSPQRTSRSRGSNPSINFDNERKNSAISLVTIS
jgi:hypothetical protein